MTEKEKMLLGKLYNASDAELQKELKRCRKLTRLFNNSTEEDIEYRSKLLKDLFGKVGKNIFIEPTFRCDYGKNIYIGAVSYTHLRRNNNLLLCTFYMV